MLFVFAMNEGAMPGNMEPASEQERLLQRVAQGERAALCELYTATKTAVYGFALSIVKSREAAEDILQDTYIRIFEAARSYRPEGKPMAWVLTITRNLARMRLREQGRVLPMPEEWEPPAPGAPFTEQSLNRMALETALHALPAMECQIVLLHSIAGMKHREIAELLGIPLSTALSKYNRALSKLKKYLKEEETP